MKRISLMVSNCRECPFIEIYPTGDFVFINCKMTKQKIKVDINKETDPSCLFPEADYEEQSQ